MGRGYTVWIDHEEEWGFETQSSSGRRKVSQKR
jgi:hypothetical protein